MSNRFNFYKINIILNNHKKYPLFVACSSKDKIKSLFEANKYHYSNISKGIVPLSFELLEEKDTSKLTETQYQEELIHIDIVEPLPQEVKKGTPVDINEKPDWL